MTTDVLDRTFAALADPTRQAMYPAWPRARPRSPSSRRRSSVTLPAISRHLKVLERAGLISRTRRAQWRPCKPGARAAQRTPRTGSRKAPAVLEERMDRLDEYLRELQDEGPPAGGGGVGVLVEAVLVVRHPGRGGDAFYTSLFGDSAVGDVTRRRRSGDLGDVPPRGPGVHGAQRRARVQLHRGDLVDGPLGIGARVDRL